MSIRGTLRRGVNAALSIAYRRPTPGRILLYHEIGDREDSAAAVPAGLFRMHRQWLTDRGLRTTTIDALRRTGSCPGTVALSFDDGHSSLLAVCAELSAAGLSATAFVVPEWIDTGRADACGWADLSALARSGIEIGAHDLAHERPCGVPIDTLTERYRAAKARIEDRIGTAVHGLAYPYGLAPPRARRAAALAGYSYAVTSEPGNNGERTDPFRLRRNEVLGTDASEAALIGKLAGTDDWFRRIRVLENAIACS